MSLPITTQSVRNRLLLLLTLIGVGLCLYIVMVEAVGRVTVNEWQPQFLGRVGFLWLNVWLPWCLMGPALVWFIRRYPITPAIWRRRLLQHLGVFLLAVFIHHLVIAYRYHYWEAPHTPSMAAYAGWQHMGHFLIGDNLFLFDAILYIVFVASFNLSDYFWALQQQTLQSANLQSSLQRAQWQMLHMQVQPHFLFNTLNAISVLLRKQDHTQALAMLQSLSRFFRHSLATPAQALIPLSSELQMLDEYLNLEKLRFGDRLQISREIDPQTLPTAVPPFILQPLVENALRHGLAELEGAGTLELRARRVDDCVSIEVSDNGVGCDFTDPGFKEGIGLQNVRERLELHYGNRVQFLKTGAPGKGARFTLLIPRAPACPPQRGARP